MASELEWLGLTGKKLPDTLKNAALTDLLTKIVQLAKEGAHADSPATTKQKGTFLYHLATRLKPQCRHSLPLAVKHIMEGSISNDTQLNAAIDFLHSTGGVGEVEEGEFKQSYGAGVSISPEQLEDAVRAVIDKHKEALLRDRYAFSAGKILADVKDALRWADGAAVKREVDMRVLLLLGPKTEEELNPQPKGKKKGGAAVVDVGMGAKGADKPAPKEPSKKEESADKPPLGNNREAVIGQDGAETIEELLKTRTNFHKVGRAKIMRDG